MMSAGDMYPGYVPQLRSCGGWPPDHWGFGDPASGQASATGCAGTFHNWPPFVGDLQPGFAWPRNGMACYCGKVRMVRSECPACHQVVVSQTPAIPFTDPTD